MNRSVSNSNNLNSGFANLSGASKNKINDGLGADNLSKRGGLKRFVLASILGGAIMVVGYAVFEALFFNLNQALAFVPFNCMQWAAGVAAATALFPAVRAAGRALK
jgi:uncharacterized membrane protein